MKLRFAAPAALAAGAMLWSAGVASAANLVPGLYRLHNHPDGNARPPLYGAKFTELYNATGGQDVYTLDFDAIQSAVFLTINAARTEIHIFGQAFGGRDTGTDYANDIYRGVYTFDFVYNIGVMPAMGDDDLVVGAPSGSNFGSITGPGGLGTTQLTDQGMDGKTFRLGDEDNDGGHRGFSGISGWGWMNYIRNGRVEAHIADTDWLFTATYEVPAPGALALVGLGGLVGFRRRRA